MRHQYLALAAALALGCAFNTTAADKDAKVAKEKVKVEKKEEVKVEKNRGGSKFKNFWIHTVGGTIGNGLKSGANKIANTFD